MNSYPSSKNEQNIQKTKGLQFQGPNTSHNSARFSNIDVYHLPYFPRSLLIQFRSQSETTKTNSLSLIPVGPKAQKSKRKPSIFRKLVCLSISNSTNIPAEAERIESLPINTQTPRQDKAHTHTHTKPKLLAICTRTEKESLRCWTFFILLHFRLAYRRFSPYPVRGTVQSNTTARHTGFELFMGGVGP